jgi:hypothetical protein
MRKDKFGQLADAREMLRLYRLMKNGKTDPKLTRDGYYPACRCVCHIDRIREDARARTWSPISEADRRLLG